jgi:arylsulfatase A-like enzyme
MKMRLPILNCVSLLTVACTLLGESRRTSIVVLMADDLGYGDVEYNQPPFYRGAKTPNINAMATSSHTIIFDNFHSSAAVCSPSRSSLISGCHPERDCVLGANAHFSALPDGQYHDTYPTRADMPCIARDSKKYGYQTYFSGKWHIGPFETRSPGHLGFDTWIASPGNIPTYDPNCFTPDASCMHNCFAAGQQCFKNGPLCYSRLSTNCVLGHYPDVSGLASSWFSKMFTGTKNGTIWNIEAVDMVRGMTTAEYMALMFRKFVSNIPASDPIFAYLYFFEPHHPFIASPEIVSKCLSGEVCRGSINPDQKTALDYFGAVVAIDNAVGTIRATLQDYIRDRDTILVFTSDVG